MARMARLRDWITHIRNGIGVNMSHANRAHMAPDNAREGCRALGKQVNGMYRKLVTLETRVREIGGHP